MTDRLGPYILGPTDDPNQGIYTGDARELAKAIPNESIDLIFTDPVYDRIDDYRWLAECGARVLKPNSACFVFHGIEWMPQTIAAMNGNTRLRYRWQFSFTPVQAGGSRFWSGMMRRCWISGVWFEISQIGSKNDRLSLILNRLGGKPTT